MLSEIAQAVAPGSRVVGSMPFVGGLSSEMIRVDVERTDGSPLQFVVRRARGDRGSGIGDRGSISMAAEFRLLEALWARGVPVPEPLHFDASGTISEPPFMVLAYVDGAPRLAPEDGVDAAHRLADVLATIHALDGSEPAFAELPQRLATTTGVLERRGPVDDTVDEGRILDALRASWPPQPPARPAVLHCDVWLGNVLWSGADVVAVIDWENAHVGARGLGPGGGAPVRSRVGRGTGRSRATRR